MKLSQASKLLLLAGVCDAFAPAKFGARRGTARSMAFDPSVLHEIPNHVQSLQEAFSSLSLSDAVAAMPDASSLVDSADVVDTAAEASKNGFFGILTEPIEMLLQIIHSALVSVGLEKDAWGVSIIGMTLFIKLLTFPLTKTQLEGTNKMQALQPAVKDIQAKYQSNPEVMNQKISEMYQTNEVNPLAGCLPSLVQIPIFIGLYRAVLELAKQNVLDEPFLFLPNLEGPVYGADPTQGSAWLFDNWVNGAPSLGWDDTVSFLILPVFLVVSQFISMEIMAPKDQEQSQSNVILKFLPLMIGWFSLNVPAALCLYWVTNNVVTTATSVIIRNSMKMEPVSAGGDSAVAAPPPQSTAFAPPPIREKPAGFSAPASKDGLKPITAIDAEVVEAVSEGDESAKEQKKSAGKKKKKKQRKN